jgi:hypothetical protein
VLLTVRQHIEGHDQASERVPVDRRAVRERERQRVAGDHSVRPDDARPAYQQAALLAGRIRSIRGAQRVRERDRRGIMRDPRRPFARRRSGDDVSRYRGDGGALRIRPSGEGEGG